MLKTHCLVQLVSKLQSVSMTESSGWQGQCSKWTWVTVQLQWKLFVLCRLKVSEGYRTQCNQPQCNNNRAHNFLLVKKLPCNVLWNFSHKTFLPAHCTAVCAMATERLLPPPLLAFLVLVQSEISEPVPQSGTLNRPHNLSHSIMWLSTVFAKEM